MKERITRKVVKTIKLLLAVFMVVGGLQLAGVPKDNKVEAATEKKAMMTWDTAKGYLNPPTYSSDQAWQGSKLYWGNDGGSPIKWRILNTNESGFGNTGMLIQSETLLGSTKFGASNVYMGSVLAGYIEGKYGSSLTSQEQSATQTSSKTDGPYTIGGV